MNEEDKQPFTQHLEELRKRLITSFIAVGIGFVACYAFKEKLFYVLVAPLKKAMRSGDTLIYTHLPEAFFTFLKTALISGIILASPVLLYQFWMFIAPGLYDREKKLLIPILFLSTLFFTGGALFGYFIVFPWGFKFFLSFATDTIRPMPSMREYLGFAAKLLLAFGIVFELPLVITFLARLGIVSVEFLKKYRKYAILIFFVGAAILTPPDVVTQIMMALPLMLLYEISIIGARIFGKSRDEIQDDDESAEQDAGSA
ncbi:MAG: twin-arginine translocase subunit TatC [Desulfobacteraceae bacterium]|jgi:sec-independent protein translocase protein TatC